MTNKQPKPVKAEERIAQVIRNVRPGMADDEHTLHMLEVAAAIRQAILEERKACWDAINAHIKTGPLQGNGCDESAQRNGLVLATNLISWRGL